MSENGSPSPIDTGRAVLIVTGSHLRAEQCDRPLAYRLRERMLAWLDSSEETGGCDIIVCSDLWYLNNDDLRDRPTISIGGPGVNALAAYLADKLPSAFTIEDVLTVQMDLDFVDLVASCWGINNASTVAAVDAFAERYLDEFLARATRAPS